MRHGNTTYDKRVDAMLDPPLTYEGHERIERTAEFIKDNGLQPTRIISSPLQRTLKSAELIGGQSSRLTVSNKALPWNLGDIQGHTDKDAKAAIESLLDDPLRKAPHGEAYIQFYVRWTTLLESLMKFAEAHDEEQVMIVTHSRNINSLQEFIDGNPIGEVTDTTPEASVTFLAKTGSGDWDYFRIWDGN